MYRGILVLREGLKRFARLAFGDYRLNRIYTREVSDRPDADARSFPVERLASAAQMREAPDARIRQHSWYLEGEARGYGIRADGALACTAVFWGRERFRDEGIWTLGEGEMILVDIVTAESSRGKGLAPAILQFAETDLARDGIRRLVSWVWHTNVPSIRMFEKSGWRYVAFAVEVVFPWSSRPSRFRFSKDG